MVCSRANFALYLHISTLITVPPVGSNMNLRDQVAKWQRWAAAANVIHFWRRSQSLGNILLFFFFSVFFFFFFFMLHGCHGNQWPTGSTVSKRQWPVLDHKRNCVPVLLILGLKHRRHSPAHLTLVSWPKEKLEEQCNYISSSFESHNGPK